MDAKNEQRNRQAFAGKQRQNHQNRNYYRICEMGSDNLRNGYINRNDFMLEFRNMALSSFRRCKRCHADLLSKQGKWLMMLHGMIWVFCALFIMFHAMLDEGRKDLLAQKAYIEGQAAVFMDMSPKQLSEYRI